MLKLEIIDISFTEVEARITKSMFDNGAKWFVYNIVIKTRIPKGYNPMDTDRPSIILTGIKTGKINSLHQLGYNCGKDEAVFICYEDLPNKIDTKNIQIYKI